MKRKPDISRFTQVGKDPTAFLEGASADMSEKSPPQMPALQVASPPPVAAAAAEPTVNAARQPDPVIEAVMPVATVQKLFRLRWDTANALRLGAAQQSSQQGKRITETEIVERLIRSSFNLTP